MMEKMTKRNELAADDLANEQISNYDTQVNFQEMLDSGMLVNVTAWATREMGYREGRVRVTVTLTAKLWGVLHTIPQELTFFQTVRGRGHDILWLAGWALKRARQHGMDCAMFLIPLPTDVDEEDAKALRIENRMGAGGRPHAVIGLAEEFPIR